MKKMYKLYVAVLLFFVAFATTPALTQPIIDVTPDSLEFTLAEGDSSIAYLIIRNNGSTTLDFELTNEFLSTVAIASNNYPESFNVIKSEKILNLYSDLEKIKSQSRSKFLTNTNLSSQQNSSAETGRMFGAGGNQIVEIDLNSGNVLNSFFTPVPTSNGPTGLAFSGEKLYFTDAFNTSDIFVINPSTGAILNSYPSPSGTVDALAFVDNNLYVLNYSADIIYELDPQNGTVLRTISPPVNLIGGLDGINGRLFASNFGSMIYELSLNDGSVINSFVPVNGVLGLGLTDSYIYASTPGGGIDKYDINTDAYLGSISSLGFAALAGGGGNGWLTEVPTEGSVLPGDSVSIEVKVITELLRGGNYNAMILINNNDPLLAQDTVHVQLQVIGTPNIVLSADTLDFGDTFIGSLDSLTLRISNDGTDLLEVFDITSDNTHFTVLGSTVFNIPLGEYNDVAIYFLPTVPGMEIGTFNISSSDSTDPNVIVHLSGNGLIPPEISVSPSSLQDSLFTGEMSVDTLTIDNLGGSDLIVDLTTNIDFSNNISGLENLHSTLLQRLMDNFEANQKLLDGETNTHSQQLNNSKFDVTSQVAADIYTGDFLRFGISDYGEIMPFQFPVGNEHLQAGLFVSGYTLAYRISGVDRIAIASFNNHSQIIPVSYTELVNNASEVIVEVVTKTNDDLLLITRTFNFKRNDKYINIASEIENISVGLVSDVIFKSYTDWDNDGSNINNWNYDLSRNMIYSWLTNYTAIASSRVPELMDIDGWNDYNQRNTIVDIPTGPAISTDGLGVIHLELGNINSGSMVQVQTVYGAGSSLAELENVIDRGIKFSHWLSLEPSSAVIPAGMSYDFEVTFDATSLYGGDYLADILIASNDIDEPELSIPAHLHVTGAPNISVAPDSIEFGSLFIGASKVDTIIVENIGTDLLNVSNIVSDNSDFQPNISGFTLNPGEDILIAVSFTPTTATLISGILTITSDDPDQPTETVYLFGEGLIPPEISVSPDSLEDSLFTNEIAFDTLTINNFGGSDLNFDLSVIPHDSGVTSTMLFSLPEVILSDNLPTIDGSSGIDSIQGNGTIQPLSVIMTEFSGKRIGFLNSSNNYTTIISDLVARGAVVVTVGYPFTPSELNSLDVLVIDDFISSVSTSNIAVIKTWLQTGKGLLLQGDNSSSVFKLNELLSGSGISENSAGGFFNSVFSNIFPHFTTEGVSSINASAYGTFCTVVSPAQTLVLDNLSRPHAAASQIGTGRVIAVGNEFSANFNLTVGDTRLFANQVFDWLSLVTNFISVEPTSGTISAGSSLDLTVTLDATNLNGGNYYADVVISSNDPVDLDVLIPTHLHVTGAPDISISPNSIDFGPLFIGLSIVDTILIENIGTDLLNISSIISDNSNFIIETANATLNPRENLEIPVTFTPTISGTINGLLLFTSDDPDQPEMSVFLSGQGLVPPEISISPDSLDESLVIGDSSIQSLTILNSGGSDLNWDLTTRFLGITTSILSSPIFSSTDDILLNKDTTSEVIIDKLPSSEVYSFDDTGIDSLLLPSTTAAQVDLVDILDKLNVGFESVTSSIPNRFNFFDGVIGTSIGDGGSDMYDGGNLLSTNLGSAITYSDNFIVNNTLFGSTGKYFTRKYPGLFVMVADMQDINYFQITGNLGADGGGNADGSILETNFNGITYKGFVKRVFNTSDPSVNHLIIVEYDTLANHEFATNTNDDYHRIQNLDNVNRIYYLLYAGTSGFYIDDNATLNIMTNFLNALELYPAWITAAPTSGSILAGQTQNVDVHFNATGLEAGGYLAGLRINSNDPDQPELLIPAHLNVFGMPDISVTPDTLDYGFVFTGASKESIVLVENSGTDILNISNITIDNSDFTSNINSFSLNIGESMEVTVTFIPSLLGPINGVMTISSDDPDTPLLSLILRGEGVAPPEIEVSPLSFAESLILSVNPIETDTLIIYNKAGSDLIWNIELLSNSAVPFNFYTLTIPPEFNSSMISEPLAGGTTVPPPTTSRTYPIQTYLNDLNGVRIMIDESHESVVSSIWQIIISDLETRGATVILNSTTVTSGLLENVDIFWLSDHSVSWSPLEINALSAWVNAGGGLLMIGDQSVISFNDILNSMGAGISFSELNGSQGITTNIVAHETTVAVDSILISNPLASLNQPTLPTSSIIVFDNSGLPNTAYSNVGNGHVITVADEIFFDGVIVAGDNQLFANQLFSFLVNKADWLSVTPQSNTTSASDSTIVEVIFTGTELKTGIYSSIIVINSNDPFIPTVEVTVELDVLEYVCGDANSDGIVDQNDFIFARESYFECGPVPNPIAAIDFNCNNIIDIADIKVLGLFLNGIGTIDCCSNSLFTVPIIAPVKLNDISN